MEEWNVVVTVRKGRFRQAWGLAASLAAIARTPFYNRRPGRLPGGAGAAARRPVARPALSRRG